MRAQTMPAAVVFARRGHYGAWRALASVPAMIGSLLLLLVLFGWLGQWEGLVLLGWLASGVAVFTSVGERVAVRVACGFRRPTPAQTASLGPVWAAALRVSGVPAAEVDLYVQRSAEVNACAVGGRSVAVTSGVLSEFVARRLGTNHMTGLLVHEVGHHATRATRFALIAMWLATPWRAASRFVIGAAFVLVGRRQPLGLLGVVVIAAVVIAVSQAAQQGQWAVVVVLSALAICGVVCPLADAAVSRRSEYAADRFAVEHGAGAELAAALRALDRGTGYRASVTGRALSRHPSVESRLEVLDAGPG